jgi:hypothetical protein
VLVCYSANLGPPKPILDAEQNRRLDPSCREAFTAGRRASYHSQPNAARRRQPLAVEAAADGSRWHGDSADATLSRRYRWFWVDV